MLLIGQPESKSLQQPFSLSLMCKLITLRLMIMFKL